MAELRTSLSMQRQILEMIKQGRSKREIARLLKVSRKTVRKILLQGAPVNSSAIAPLWSTSIDWDKVHLEVSRGVQFNILAKEHASDIISYVQFCREYKRRFPREPKVTMRLEHKPGEKCFFDYTDGIDIVDRRTGEVTKTSLFCGVMAMSSMTWGECMLTQKREELTRSIEKAFRYFGGVTPYVTVDNQRAAVDRSDWYDPDVNPSFVDFANHWGLAVIPARPYRPQDKAANESGIGVAQRQFDLAPIWWSQRFVI